MQEFEVAVEAACASGVIAGAVAVARDRTGKLEYARAFGKRSIRAGVDQSALKLDAVMWVASCTKLVTSIAAMQCVERGLLSLDRPVYDVLPELRGLPLIKSIGEDGIPVMETHRNTITLRRLLDHSSGLAYDVYSPQLIAWQKWRRRQIDDKSSSRTDTVETRFNHPLVFEPGESWQYGPGVDWAGVAVERVNGGISLQRYCEEHISGIVGARDIVFSNHIRERPDMAARMMDLSRRVAKDKVEASDARLPWSEDGGCFGGMGMFASAPAYLKIISSLLAAKEGDQVLLGEESLREYFRPGLSSRAKAALNKTTMSRDARPGTSSLPRAASKDWALCGIINEQGRPDGRAAGTTFGGGLPNQKYFIDRKTGLCGFFATYLVPPDDPQVLKIVDVFENSLYRQLRESRYTKL